MQVHEMLSIEAHNASVAGGRALTQTLQKHIGRRFADMLYDGWTQTTVNLTGKPRQACLRDEFINLELNRWQHGDLVNAETKRVVLSDITIKQLGDVDWSTKSASGSDQTYNLEITIPGFPEPEEFMARVAASNSFTNGGDKVLWHDVCGRKIQGVGLDDDPDHGQATTITVIPRAVAQQMLIAVDAAEDAPGHQVEHAYTIADYLWTYC